jgi:hypothetical protein
MIVINKAPRHHTIAHHCVLLPGTNNIPDATWREAEKIPVIQHYLKTREIEVKPGDITKMSVPDALDVIKNTYDLATLGRLGAEERRKPVIEAITLRKEELAAFAKKATQKDT